MRSVHGILLMATGIIHVIFGLLPHAYLIDWKTFLSAGLWDTVNIGEDRAMAAFWFVASGLFMLLAGTALYEMEKRLKTLPSSVGVICLGITALGCIMSPQSGFTVLLLPQAIFYLVRSSTLNRRPSSH